MRADISQALRIVNVRSPDRTAEAAAISVMQEAFDPAYGEAWTAAQLGGFMSLPGVILSLAYVDNACLGFALTRHIVDEAELLLIATEPRWQNRGIGECLLQQCISLARISGIKNLHLEVRSNNRAIEFYMRYGFEHIHVRPSYYKGKDGTCYDAFSFRLSLG